MQRQLYDSTAIAGVHKFACKLTGKRDTQGQETEQCRNTSYNCASMYEGTTNDSKIDTVLPGVRGKSRSWWSVRE